MACPTCSHTMQAVVAERGIFWCPRCGTLKMESARYGIEPPKLVECLRSFARSISSGVEGRWLRMLMHESGVSESILTPEQRPEVK